ncbi:hypothetical protein [Streptomyces sp. NPDC050534]|uniref:hypothetical protein n=1 Tax=Streptomyces sp. NPDC050534 TaxID=3365625 RepID=UPI003793528B
MTARGAASDSYRWFGWPGRLLDSLSPFPGLPLDGAFPGRRTVHGLLTLARL